MCSTFPKNAANRRCLTSKFRFMLTNFRFPLPYFSVFGGAAQKNLGQIGQFVPSFRENKSTFFSMLRTFSKSSPEDGENASAWWRITPHVGRKEASYSDFARSQHKPVPLSNDRDSALCTSGSHEKVGGCALYDRPGRGAFRTRRSHRARR